MGGGPAGAAAARLLALWGRDVVLAVKPGGPDEADLPESLTPSCQKFFDLLGISPDIERAGFIRSTGHTVWWGADARSEPFDGGRLGWQVTTGRLGRLMVELAAAAGARVVERPLTREEALAWPARFRVDATGRTGVLARALGGRRYEPGHRTVALIGVWGQTGAWSLDDPSHTLLESYGDGWAWSVPVGPVTRALAVMVDPKTTSLARGDGATAVYLSEVSKTQQLARIFAAATLQGPPAGWDASMYVAERFSGDGWLLAGDAGSFVDPLSSAGVRKAMASGWQAAVTLNTALARPDMTATAWACFTERERQTYGRFLALTRRFLAMGAPSSHPFWTDRIADLEADDDDREAVRAAFADLKSRAEVRLQLGSDVRIEARPAWHEREIVLEPHLVTPLVPGGVRFVEGVDVVTLTRLAPGHRQVPDLFEACAREAGATDLSAFLTALSTAVARRWLIPG